MMFNSLSKALRNGSSNVLLLGSDIPGITPSIMNHAFEVLNCSSKQRDVVLGPAQDGGFYLIGARRLPHGSLSSKEIEWSTAKVLDQTKAY